MIKPSANEEFYENIERWISYITTEIQSLTNKNDETISKGFGSINAKAELSGAEIQYLSTKYNQK